MGIMFRTGLTRDFCPPSVELQACQADSFIGQLAKGEGGLRVAHVHHDPQSQWIATAGPETKHGGQWWPGSLQNWNAFFIFLYRIYFCSVYRSLNPLLWFRSFFTIHSFRVSRSMFSV
jgi:hypothetical protein